MTWSIIARDPATGQFGIAVATKFFAVGARVPHIAAGIGGIATQALVNPYYGIDGVKLLREGREPGDIVNTLIAGDGGRESRQLHIMDAKRPHRRAYRPRLRRLVRTYPGRRLLDCRQHAGRRRRARRHRESLCRQRQTAVSATADRGDACRRSRRRRQARQAIGRAADPRRRGMVRRSICASTTTPIRCANSSGWKQVSRERWVHFRAFLPTRDNPAGITDRATIDAGIAASIAAMAAKT